MSRTTKQDWLRLGLGTLASEGTSGLTIDSLTQKLSITKGSFYHHFQSYDDYKNTLLAFWNEQYTQRIIDFSEHIENKAQIFQRFVEILCSESPAVEIAIRSWAFQDVEVQSYVQRIDQLRIQYAKEWFDQTLPNQDQSQAYAVLLNAALIGSYSTFPPLIGDDLRSFLRTFFECLGIRI